jgi:hypothetical protein
MAGALKVERLLVAADVGWHDPSDGDLLLLIAEARRKPMWTFGRCCRVHQRKGS